MPLTVPPPPVYADLPNGGDPMHTPSPMAECTTCYKERLQGLTKYAQTSFFFTSSPQSQFTYHNDNIQANIQAMSRIKSTSRCFVYPLAAYIMCKSLWKLSGVDNLRKYAHTYTQRTAIEFNIYVDRHPSYFIEKHHNLTPSACMSTMH